MSIYDESFAAFVCFGYGRASTDHQTMSTEQQESACLDVFQFKKRRNPEWANAVWGGFAADEATSRSTTFRERHAASLILAQAKPGDRIMCAAQDRLCGDLVDFCKTMDLFHEMHFKLVVGDQEIDPDDETGMCVRKILAAFAEHEVKRLRRRVRENMAYRRRIGRPTSGPPIGWMNSLNSVPGRGRQRFLVPDHTARKLALELLRVREQHADRTDVQVLQFCNFMGLKQRDGRVWTGPTFRKWIRAARGNFPLPNGSHEAAPIPPDAVPVVINTISADA